MRRPVTALALSAPALAGIWDRVTFALKVVQPGVPVTGEDFNGARRQEMFDAENVDLIGLGLANYVDIPADTLPPAAPVG